MRIGSTEPDFFKGCPQPGRVCRLHGPTQSIRSCARVRVQPLVRRMLSMGEQSPCQYGGWRPGKGAICPKTPVCAPLMGAAFPPGGFDSHTAFGAGKTLLRPGCFTCKQPQFRIESGFNCWCIRSVSKERRGTRQKLTDSGLRGRLRPRAGRTAGLARSMLTIHRHTFTGTQG